MCRKLFALSLLVGGLIQIGCQPPTTQITYEGLKKELYHPESARWFYVGTKDDTHYLVQRLPVESFFPIPESKYLRTFRITTNELPLDAPFPLTTDRSAWKPVFRKKTGMSKGRDFPWEVSIDYMPGLRESKTNSPWEMGDRSRQTTDKNE